MRFALLMMMVACACAQPQVDIHPVTGRASERQKEAERQWRTAQQSSWRDANTPEELAVVAAVATFYKQVFQPELPSALKIATVTEKGQDVLVARWRLSRNPTPFSELIVWDTPQSTSFIFQLPRRSWASDPAIRSSFKRLLLPPRSDGRTPPAKGVTLNIARDPYTQRWVGAGGILLNYFQRQFDVGPMNWFDLWETSAASYLAATFSQFAMPGFPVNMRSIAERFPPLESRVGQWSKKRILDELGPGGFNAAYRDRVLANELLRRDLTDDELLSVLRRRQPDQSGTVLWAVVQARQVSRFAGAIRRYLDGDCSHPQGHNPFDVIRGSDEVNFTEVAIDVLHPGCRADAAFRYAAAHGTVADYRALSELPRLEVGYGREELRSPAPGAPVRAAAIAGAD
jgi:hypothetical protein